MEELKERIQELTQAGLCCSQIVLQIVGLEARGEENDELIRAMGALGYGAYCQLACGALTGGAAALALYAEDGLETKQMVGQLGNWFRETFKGGNCEDILGAGNPPDLPACMDIVARTIQKCFEIVEDKL